MHVLFASMKILKGQKRIDIAGFYFINKHSPVYYNY